jgi:hypothetical protein
MALFRARVAFALADLATITVALTIILAVTLTVALTVVLRFQGGILADFRL